MSDTNIETEVELFDVLAKYGIAKVKLEFDAVYFEFEDLKFGDIHKMTFEGEDSVIPKDVRDAICLAVATFGRVRANKAECYHNEDSQEPEEWGTWEDSTLTFDVARRRISFEGDFVQITTVGNDWNVDDEARWGKRDK
jgi:hypothetical protein